MWPHRLCGNAPCPLLRDAVYGRLRASWRSAVITVEAVWRRSLRYLLSSHLQKTFVDPLSGTVDWLYQLGAFKNYSSLGLTYHRSETEPRRQFIRNALVDSDVKPALGITVLAIIPLY